MKNKIINYCLGDSVKVKLSDSLYVKGFVARNYENLNFSDNFTVYISYGDIVKGKAFKTKNARMILIEKKGYFFYRDDIHGKKDCRHLGLYKYKRTRNGIKLSYGGECKS